MYRQRRRPGYDLELPSISRNNPHINVWSLEPLIINPALILLLLLLLLLLVLLLLLPLLLLLLIIIGERATISSVQWKSAIYIYMYVCLFFLYVHVCIYELP